jgi:hypothetical protein
MQRRDFLKQAAVVGGVVAVGIPEFPFAKTVEESDETVTPNYTLFGVKKLGCALPRNYHHQAEQFPDHVARLLG